MIIPTTKTLFLEQEKSFESWQRQVNSFKKQLIGRPEKTWLLFEQDCYQFSILFFALLAANRNIVLPQNGQTQQLQQCMLKVDGFIGSEPPPNSHHFDLANAFEESENSHPKHLSNDQLEPIEFSSDNPITFFTSGSSGEPKAILKSIGQLLLEVETLESTFAKFNQNFDDSTIFLATVSHQHFYGLLFKVLWPIWTGRKVYFELFQFPEHLVHKIKLFPQANIVLISSPAFYHRLHEDNLLVQLKSQLNLLLSSGGPLKANVAMQLGSELGNIPVEVLGSTETGGIAWKRTENLRDDPWLPFENITFKIEANTQRLLIKSPYMINKVNAKETSWYSTDDRAETVESSTQNSSKRFKLLGRIDRIVKIEEKRCSLDEIQSQLIQHPWIKAAYVLAIGGKKGVRLSTGAVIELSDLGKKELIITSKFKFDQQIRVYLKNYFEAIVVPRKFRHLENLPFNTQGKLNKPQMEALFD